MPKLSQRISTINGGGSDGWDVFYRARRMIADGESVIELTIGEHDIGTDPAILNQMHASATGGHTGYAEVPGVDSLRDAVAKRIADRTGVDTQRDNVLITPGAQSALYAAHVLAAGDGHSALHIDPYYATYPSTIRAAGARPVAIETRASDAFLPQEAALDSAIQTYQARSLLINSPNNPTGAVYSKSVIESIARVVARRDIWLISDEVYESQVWEGDHISPRSLPGMAANTLVVGSMSKSHAMTGSRVGWIVGPEDAIKALIDLATNTTYGVPGFVQDASTFALEQGDDMEALVSAPFLRRRNMATDVIAGQDVVSMVPAQGAMYVMLDVRKTGMTGSAFAEALLDAHKIAVMPGESFGHAAAGHVRVALTVDDKRLESALETLCLFAAERASAVPVF